MLRHQGISIDGSIDVKKGTYSTHKTPPFLFLILPEVYLLTQNLSAKKPDKIARLSPL